MNVKRTMEIVHLNAKILRVAIIALVHITKCWKLTREPVKLWIHAKSIMEVVLKFVPLKIMKLLALAKKALK
jgi:hypothetical protein